MNPHARKREQESTSYLYHELCFVCDTYQIIDDTNQKQHHHTDKEQTETDNHKIEAISYIRNT